nr:STAS domain-containing protein [Saccharopolyspora sp. HNM0983]
MHVRGVLDGEAAQHLSRRLWPRLLARSPATALDLSAVTTVDSAGLHLLSAAHSYAQHRGIALRLVVSANPDLTRVLTDAGLPPGAAACPRASRVQARGGRKQPVARRHVVPGIIADWQISNGEGQVTAHVTGSRRAALDRAQRQVDAAGGGVVTIDEHV